jgi:hypothetical protein
VNGKKPKNVAASVRQRLLNLSRKTGEDFQLVLTRYAVERLLYRLGVSEHSQRFILKGAMLFALWTGRMHRPTWDVDLLGFGEDSEAALAGTFRSLCEAPVPDDGLVFAADTVAVRRIREDQEYGGERVTFDVRLGTARVTLQYDRLKSHLLLTWKKVTQDAPVRMEIVGVPSHPPRPPGEILPRGP